VWKEEEEKENEGTSQGQHAVDAIAADTSFLARRIALLPAAPAHLRERERERERGVSLLDKLKGVPTHQRTCALLRASLCFFVLLCACTVTQVPLQLRTLFERNVDVETTWQVGTPMSLSNKDTPPSLWFIQ
jgi:hypothetical protein